MKIFSEEKKDIIKYKDAEMLAVDFKVPRFEGEKEKVCKNLNNYYEACMQNFYNFCSKNYVKKLDREGFAAEKNCPRKQKAVLTYYIPYSSENVLSVIADAGIYDGKSKKIYRLIRNFDLSDGYFLQTKKVVDTSVASRKFFMEKILDKIELNENGFYYFENAKYFAKRKFNINNFYFSSNGIAFFYEKNILFNSDGIYPSYVVNFKEASKFLNMDFLKTNTY